MTTNLHDDIVDYIILGIQKSPGVATVKNVKNPRKWDVAQGYGFSGATTRFMGNELATFDVEIVIWTAEHWIDWAAFKGNVQKTPPGAIARALGIYHPVLAEEGITAVVIKDSTGWDQSEHGLWSRTISFLEFKAPRLAFGKPGPAIPAATAPVPTAQDAADRVIESQLQTIDALTK